MLLSRWKLMAGVLGISIGGLAAAASQCPKLDTSRGRSPEAPVSKDEPKVAPAGPAAPPVPVALPTPPELSLPGVPAAPQLTPSLPAPVVLPASGTLPQMPGTPGLPDLVPAAPKAATPPAVPAPPDAVKPEGMPTRPSATAPVTMPPLPESAPPKADLPPALPTGAPPAVNLTPPPPGRAEAPVPPPVKPAVPLPPGAEHKHPLTPVGLVGAPQPTGGPALPPPPSGTGSTTGAPALGPTEEPPSKPLPAPGPVVATPVVGESKFRILLRVGEGEPTFEVKSGDNLVLKVACEKVDIKSPEKGNGLSEVTARGKVRFAGFGAEGTCDELKFLAGNGEVSMTGDVKVIVRDKLGRVESELSGAGPMRYKIDASAVAGQIKP
jgi:hypothetical protein